MATTTPNLGLTIPNPTTDPADIAVINNDFSIIDTAFGVRASGSSPLVLANTTSESVVATLTLPANTAAATNAFKIVALGIASTTGTPNLTFRVRIGNLTGPSLGTITSVTGSGLVNAPWWIEGNAYVVTTGVSGTWYGGIQLVSSLNTTSPNYATVGIIGSTVIKDTTVSNDLVLTAQWNTASASNTLTRTFYYGHREA